MFLDRTVVTMVFLLIALDEAVSVPIISSGRLYIYNMKPEEVHHGRHLDCHSSLPEGYMNI